MPPWVFLAIAWCAGAAAAPLSGEAHQVTASQVLGAAAVGGAFGALPHVAAAFALGFFGRAAWRELTPVPLVIGLAGAEGLRFLSADVRTSVLTVSVGVLGTAAMLATLRVAPRSLAPRSGLRDNTVVATTLALAGVPGASPVACALAARAWSGRRVSAPAAALWAVPFELRSAWASGPLALPVANLAEVALAASLALLGAAAGAGLLRLGPERVARLAVPYLGVLGAALLAYAWSLR